MKSTVLITTATAPPKNMPHLAMTSAAARRITAKAAVFFWAAQGIEKIVIADATGNTLINSDEILLLKQMNVSIEQIHYLQNNELIKSRGKGYAEGELIKFSLENSSFLKNENNFFKCTGKVYCRNFREIFEMIKQHGLENIFWRHIGDGDPIQPWADMRFFYTSKNFCEKYLIPAYLNADDNMGQAAEYYCFNMLNEKLPTAKAFRPLLSGFSGGTGDQYFDLSFGALDFNYPCWAGK